MTSTTEPQSPSDPGWVSRVCVAWVIDDAPCPTELLPVLTTIARRCSNDGTGSYQSKATLAKRTGKSRDQVEADVKRLLELGLIRKGDQSLLNDTKIPDWQRPVVYDVALEMRGDKPTRAGRNKSGKNKRTETPGTGTPGGTDTPPGTDTPTPGGTDTPHPPGMDTPQINPSKNPSNKTQREMPAKKITSRQRADAEGFRMLTVVRSYNEREALHLIRELNRKFGIYSAQWWIEADENGSLDTRIEEVKAEYKAEQAAKKEGRNPQPMAGLPDPWAA